MNSISPSSAAALSNLVNVNVKGDVPMTTSLKVAEIYGKMHKNVLQAIENLDCSAEFKERNVYTRPSRASVIGNSLCTV
jgi:phage regulator Rha-like protein